MTWAEHREQLTDRWCRAIDAFMFAVEGGAGEEWLEAANRRLNAIERQLEQHGVELAELTS